MWPNASWLTALSPLHPCTATSQISSTSSNPCLIPLTHYVPQWKHLVTALTKTTQTLLVKSDDQRLRNTNFYPIKHHGIVARGFLMHYDVSTRQFSILSTWWHVFGTVGGNRSIRRKPMPEKEYRDHLARGSNPSCCEVTVTVNPLHSNSDVLFNLFN